jgi:hypothetical protein
MASSRDPVEDCASPGPVAGEDYLTRGSQFRPRGWGPDGWYWRDRWNYGHYGHRYWSWRFDPEGAVMQIAWAIPTGLTWIFILGCGVAAWIVGFGTGYRKGVRDAIKDKLLTAAPALDRE